MEKIIVIFFIFLVFLGSGIGGYFLYIKYFNKNTIPPTTTPTPTTIQPTISPSTSTPAPLKTNIIIGTKTINDGDTINFKSGRTNKFCTYDDDNWSLRCSRTVAQSWENFDVKILDINNNVIALKNGRTGKYCADKDDVKGLQCKSDNISDGEKFIISPLDGNNFSLKSNRTGKYCRDDDDVYGVRCTTPSINNNGDKFII